MATSPAHRFPGPRRYFYPRPRVEGDSKTLSFSTRAAHFYPRPRVEGDPIINRARANPRHFYPRPRVEGDVALGSAIGALFEFLSTPSRRGRLIRRAAGLAEQPISIHALRMEGDCRDRGAACQCQEFLSTPSAWRATASTRILMTRM